MSEELDLAEKWKAEAEKWEAQAGKNLALADRAVTAVEKMRRWRIACIPLIGFVASFVPIQLVQSCEKNETLETVATDANECHDELKRLETMNSNQRAMLNGALAPDSRAAPEVLCPRFPGPDAIGLIAYTERTDPMDPAVRNLRAHLSFRVYGKWYSVGYGLGAPMTPIFTQPIDTWPFDECWDDYDENNPECHEWEYAYRAYKAAFNPNDNNWTGGYGTLDLPDMLPLRLEDEEHRPTIRWNLESHFMWSDTTIHRWHTRDLMAYPTPEDPDCENTAGCNLGPDESSPLRETPHYVYRALWMPLDWPTQGEAPNICKCAECPECDAAMEYRLLGCDRGRDAGDG